MYNWHVAFFTLAEEDKSKRSFSVMELAKKEKYKMKEITLLCFPYRIKAVERKDWYYKIVFRNVWRTINVNPR